MLKVRVSVRQAKYIEDRFVLDKVKQQIFPRSVYSKFKSNRYLLSVYILQEKMHFATLHLRPLSYNCLKMHICDGCCDCSGQQSQDFLLNHKARCSWSFPLGQIFHLMTNFHLPLSFSLFQTLRPKLFI